MNPDADTYDNNYYNDVKCTSWRLGSLDSPTTRPFIQRFISAIINENINLAFVRKIHPLLVISQHKGPVRQKALPWQAIVIFLIIILLTVVA